MEITTPTGVAPLNLDRVGGTDKIISGKRTADPSPRWDIDADGVARLVNLRAFTTGSSLALQSSNGTNRVQVNDTGLGFFNATPVAKPTITGSRGLNAALASLLTQLAALGIITDGTTT